MPMNVSLSYANVIVGNGFGNCNNQESKYVKAYSPDILNTIDKMAQKRAFWSVRCYLLLAGRDSLGKK